MTPPVKKIKHKLSIDEKNADLYLGLVSAEADYKISLLINRELRINLRSNTPVIKTGDSKEIRFSRFVSGSKFSTLSYELISNHSGKANLLARTPSLDYILRIKELSGSETINNIIRKIRNIREITGVFVLDKNKQIESSVLQILP